MDRTLAHPAHRLAVALAVAAIGACGGGGAETTTPTGFGNGLSVSPASLGFSADHLGTAVPQVVTVTVTAADADHVVVGPLPGASVPSWLKLTLDGAATPPTVTATASAGTLAAGARQTAFRVSIVRADGSTIGYVDVPVSFTVVPFAPEANPSSLYFRVPIGGTPPAAQSVTLDAITDSYAWIAATEYTGGAGWLLVNGGATASGPALPSSLSVSIAGSALSEGYHYATISVAGAGGTVPVPVTLEVFTPTLTIPAFPDSFQATSGQASLPAGRQLELQSGGASIGWTATVEYDAGASGWLDLPTSGTAPQTLLARPNTTGLAPGTYVATVTFTPANGTAPVVRTFGYTLSAPRLLTATTSAWFFLKSTSVVADLTQSFTLASVGATLTWTATPSAPWLTVSQTTGSGSATLSVTVNPQLMLDLGQGGAGKIRFDYTGPWVPPGAFIEFPVNLGISLPSTDRVTPYVAYEGEAKPIIVRGGTFSPTSTNALIFGSSAPVNTTWIGYNAVRVTPPPTLPAGLHVVKLAENPNNLGLNPAYARLLVLPVTPHTAGVIPSAGVRSRLVYDAERRCVYAAETQGGVLQRFCDGPSGWVTDGLSLPGIRDVALSVDGLQLVAITADTVHRISAATLAPIDSFDGFAAMGVGQFDTVALPHSGHLLVQLSTDYVPMYEWVFGSATPAWENGGVASAVQSTSLPTRMAASFDAGRVVTGDRTSDYKPPLEVVVHDGVLNWPRRYPASGPVTSVALDRDGSRIAAGGWIYDGSVPNALTSLGSVGSPVVALSPDGDRAWVLALDPLDPAKAILHTWDVSGTSVAEVGTGAGVSTTPVGYPTPENLMIASLDGRTLFIDDRSGILVLPAP
ncbi:MAG TPA: hypothetical protein VLT61_11915 [Anaeromyxobacteraceae bacterium]|nr:hypothetical protein [Anaeromyxobacteraceae bacterium]